MEEYKHYIRLDSHNYITNGFSDFFENPLVSDIYIHDGGRQFELNGEINPPLYKEGIPIYKWDGGNAIPLTETEIQNYKASLPPSPPTPIEELQAQNAQMILALVQGGLM